VHLTSRKRKDLLLDNNHIQLSSSSSPQWQGKNIHILIGRWILVGALAVHGKQFNKRASEFTLVWGGHDATRFNTTWQLSKPRLWCWPHLGIASLNLDWCRPQVVAMVATSWTPSIQQVHGIWTHVTISYYLQCSVLEPSVNNALAQQGYQQRFRW
jgi:hypothetical protein